MGGREACGEKWVQKMKMKSGFWGRVLFIALLSHLAILITANAAVTVIGAQYKPDRVFPEYDCYWNFAGYPNSCRTNQTGATVYVYLKNTGTSAALVTDATLAGYSLKTAIAIGDASVNPGQQNSIYFYWDDPPADILAAGEPVWYRVDPPTIPAGGVAQVTVRLRLLPVTQPLSLAVVTSAGTVSTNITVDAAAPRVAGIGYSEDLKKIYLHWRRSGGAAPTSVWLDGTNVTALTTTVGDPNVNFAASVISLSNALPFFTCHVFQGIYADGKTATAAQRAWTNKFIYATYSTFYADANYTAGDWLDEAANHGFNNVQYNLGAMGSYMGTVAGQAHMRARGYGYTILDPGKLNPIDPDMWFLNDEPDIDENNQCRANCGAGLRIPCDATKYAGTLVMKEAVRYATELRTLRPNVPTVVNLDGELSSQSFYVWGQAVDVLQSDNYYDVQLRNSYVNYPNRVQVYKQAKLSYAVARTASEAASPNPFNHLLFCTKQTDPDWPYPTPESKRIEVYYSLAGGSKGMGYWWFNQPYGLNASAECASLWKEMGLCGNEIKTARDLIVKSVPVDLALTPSASVWARAVASGVDTLMLYAVNDNYYSDLTGCHYTPVNNATVTTTLPLWMRNAPTAFEITAGGLRDVTTQLNGSQLVVNLGTLNLTRMIIVTTDPQLRTTIQQRYDSQVRPGVCTFAPELCVTHPPTIAQQPANQRVVAGATVQFTLLAGGDTPLFYRWQKNQVNLNNGGHYSGCTTPTLTVTGADQNDVANYRCVVTNAYGSTNSSAVTLTLATYNSCLEVANANFESGFALASGGYIATNWTEWETDAGVIVGYDEPAIVHDGAHSQRLRVWGGTNGSSGGLFQQVPVVLGQPFTVGVWTYAADTSTYASLGVNPSGGTNPASGVIWSTANNTAAWVQKSVSGTATTSYLTVFLKVASSDSTKRNAYFDDAITPECANQPPGINQQPANQSVIAGGTASFEVVAAGSNPLTYQWQKGPAGIWTNLGPGGHYSGTTTPLLTITGVDANDLGSYRCVVTNAYGTTNSAAASLAVVTPNRCLALLNPDLESGFTIASGGYLGNNWTEWETIPGNTIGYDETVLVHGGGHSQRLRVSSTNATSGGVYQRVPVTAGGIYSVSVWVYAGDNWSACSLGVDPAGGTNVNSGVVWVPATTNTAWVQQTWSGIATANYLTVFYKVASFDNQKRNGYFDDATPAGLNGPLELDVHSDGANVTLSWPECPPARLEQPGTLLPSNWVPAPNEGTGLGGRRIVTLAPTGNTGFFRLRLAEDP